MQGIVRIIGGEWRGRKLKVPTAADLRPTPDRVRETLFNWLAPALAGACCLDAFAGTGALGFEALSRGAARVVMIDQSAVAIQRLREHAQLLKTDRADIYQAQLPQQLKPSVQPFDIVFLDPPYASKVLLACCFHLENQRFLAEKAYIYLEARETLTDSLLPPNWRIVKNKRAGQVAYHLAVRYTAPFSNKG